MEYSGVHRDTQGYAGVHRGTQGRTGGHRGTQGLTGICIQYTGVQQSAQAEALAFRKMNLKVDESRFDFRKTLFKNRPEADYRLAESVTSSAKANNRMAICGIFVRQEWICVYVIIGIR